MPLHHPVLPQSEDQRTGAQADEHEANIICQEWVSWGSHASHCFEEGEKLNDRETKHNQRDRRPDPCLQTLVSAHQSTQPGEMALCVRFDEQFLLFLIIIHETSHGSAELLWHRPRATVLDLRLTPAISQLFAALRQSSKLSR